jgi:hypothetical protein
VGRHYGARPPPGRILELELEALESQLREKLDKEYDSANTLQLVRQLRERVVKFFGPSSVRWVSGKREQE